MKKDILKIAATGSALALLLAGCSSTDGGNGTEGEFASHSYQQAPIWDLSDFDISLWPSGHQDEETVSPVSAMSTENVYMVSENGECNLSATIHYADSFRANRGDEFNSYDLLYSRAANDMMNIENPIVENINGVDFVVGEYTATDLMLNEDGDMDEKQVYKKSAIRVFDKLLPIPGLEDEENIEGPYKSDLTKGLPLAEINVICEQKDQLTDEMWKNGVERFIIDFTGESQDSVFMPTEGDGGVPSDELHPHDDVTVEDQRQAEEIDNIVVEENPDIVDELVIEVDESDTGEEN